MDLLYDLEKQRVAKTYIPQTKIVSNGFLVALTPARWLDISNVRAEYR